MYAQPMPPQEDPVLARLRMAGRVGMLNRPPMPEQAQGHAYGRLGGLPPGMGGDPLPQPIPQPGGPAALPVPGVVALPHQTPVAAPSLGLVGLPQVLPGQPGTMNAPEFKRRPPVVRQG